MTLAECEARIGKYRNEYAEGFKTKNTSKIFMRDLSLIIDAAPKSGIVKRTEELVLCGITNSFAMGVISADFKSADITAKLVEEKCAELISKNSTESGSNLSIYFIADGTVFEKEMYDKIHETIDNIRGLHINISLYGICLINEVRTDKSLVEKDKNALKALLEYADKDCIFVLGRRRLNGSVINTERAIEDYSLILSNLIINAHEIRLTHGTYSFGTASLLQSVKTFWTQALLKASNRMTLDGDDDENSASKENLSRFCETINTFLREGYSNNISVDIMSDILCNDAAIASNDDINTAVKKLYGNSLEVYLTNERTKAQNALKKLQGTYDEIMKRVSGSEADKLLERVIPMLEEQTRSIQMNGEYTPSLQYDAFAENDIKAEIFRQYLQPNTLKILNQYYAEGLKIAAASTKKALENQKRIKADFALLKENIHSAALNYINTEGELKIEFDAPKINAVKTRAEDYTDAVCSEITNALNINDTFKEVIEQNKDAFLRCFTEKAEPYCCNNIYNVTKNYYMLVNSKFAEEIAASDNNIKELHAEYLGDSVLLNCSRIDLGIYIEMI